MKKTITIFSLILFINTILVFSGEQQQKSLQEIYKTGKVRFAEVLKISTDSLPEGTILKFAGDVIEDKDDNIFLLDIESDHILKLDKKGQLIKVIGRYGQGPGDFYIPSCMASKGENIFVYEFGNRRFSVFNFAGDFIKIVKPEWIEKKGLINKIRFLSNGDLVIESIHSHSKEQSTHQMILEIYSPNFEFKKRMYSQLFSFLKYVGNVKVTQPFPQLVKWDISPFGNIVIGFSEKFNIEIHDISSKKLKIIKHKYKPIKISDKEKKNFLNKFASGSKKPGNIPDIIKNNLVFPENKPAFFNIVIDIEGNILVFPEANSSFFYAFDRKGKYINNVEILSGKINPRIMKAEDECFWCSGNDDNGHYIVKYKIIKKK